MGDTGEKRAEERSDHARDEAANEKETKVNKREAPTHTHTNTETHTQTGRHRTTTASPHCDEAAAKAQTKTNKKHQSRTSEEGCKLRTDKHTARETATVRVAKRLQPERRQLPDCTSTHPTRDYYYFSSFAAFQWGKDALTSSCL